MINPDRKSIALDPLAERHVDHRNGAGHLDPEYEVDLRARTKEARSSTERAFIPAGWSDDPSAQESGEEFVMTVTSGEDGGESGLDEESIEERGGPFIETDGSVEFAYGIDKSNPKSATREPFPRS